MDALTYLFEYPAERVDGEGGAAAHGSAAAPRAVPVAEPVVSAMDSSAERGDGVFETFGVTAGHAQALGPHLRRLAGSLAQLEIPPADLGALERIVVGVAAQADPGTDCSLKLVVTRGRAGEGPRSWIVLSPSAYTEADRRDGIRVVTLDRGFSSTAARDAPWLLLGAKTLSYATNLAAAREARRRGATDALFVTCDGYALEGPTSTLIVRQGDTLVTPDPAIGILHGTTQQAVFDFAAQTGRFATAYRPLTLDEVRASDGAWFTSSVRLAVAVTHLDGTALGHDPALTAEFDAFLSARRS